MIAACGKKAEASTILRAAGTCFFTVTSKGTQSATAGTAPEITERLSKSLQTALADPGVIQAMADLGTAPSPAADATPDALKAKLSSEIARWQPVIQAAGVYAD